MTEPQVRAREVFRALVPRPAGAEPCPVFVTRCPFCGLVLDVDPDAASWHEAVLWGYVAQQDHEATGECRPTLL